MPPAIDPAPENPETAENLDTPVGLTVVDTIVAGLSREIDYETIAKSVGVTVYVVEIVAKNRALWAANPPKPSKQRETRSASKGKTRGRKGIAPEGAKVVEPYWCDGHLSTFLPCQICKIRNLAK